MHTDIAIMEGITITLKISTLASNMAEQVKAFASNLMSCLATHPFELCSVCTHLYLPHIYNAHKNSHLVI